MANKQLQLRRGDASAHNSFTGAEGEVTVNTTNTSIHVHDGSSAGGTELARADLGNMALTGDLSLQSQKITNLADPVGAQDAANKRYVDAQISGGAVAFEFITGVSLSEGVLADIADGNMLMFIDGKVQDITIGGNVTIGTDGAVTIGDGQVTNGMLVNSGVSVNANTLSLGGSLTVQGTSDEIEVSTTGGTITVGLPDSVVVAGQVSAASLSLSGNASVGGDMVVSGNLTVSGTTTTVNSTEVLLADSILTLNSDINPADAPTENAGLEVARGADAKASLLWNETTDAWGVKLTGSTFYNLRHKGVEIVEADIADAAITTDKLADDSVVTVKIQDAAITNAKLAGGIVASNLAGGIGSDKLSDFTDTLEKTSGNLMAANGSTFTSLPTGGDVTASISGGTLSFAITSGVIVNADISASAAIEGSKLADTSIQSGKLADSAVVTAKIADGNVTAQKLASDALSNFDTDDLAEGTNLYFTDARAVSAVTASAGSVHGLFAAGNGLSLSNGTFALTDSFTVAGNITAGSFIGALTGDVTGTVSDISNHNTGDLTEGSNLYFTDARARASVSATDNGGDGSLSYDSATGVFSFTGPSAAEVRAHFSAGTGVDITGGTLSIGQAVGSADDVTFNTVTAGTFTGALAGNVTGTVSSISNHDTDDLSEGATNLYYTDTRARASVSVTDNGGDGALSYNSATGVFSFTGPSAAEVRAHFSAGTGVDITGGAVSIGQAVETTSDVTFNTVTADTFTGVHVGNVIGDLTGDVTGNISGATATLTGTLSALNATLSGDLAVDGGDITSTAATLSISSSTGNVQVESVVFNGADVSGVADLTASGTVTANTFVGAFSGAVSSDVLAASTLTVSARFKLDSAEFYIDDTEVTATAAEINRLASIDTNNDVADKLAVVNSDGYIHGSFKSLSSQGGTGALLQNVLFDVRDVNGDTVFKIDPVSSDETIVKTARLAVDDSLLQVNANTSSSAVDNQHDIGLFGNLGAGKAAAVVYDRSDAAWKFVDDVNIPENAINTIAPTDAQLSDLEIKGIRTAAGVRRAVATFTDNSTTLDATHHIVFIDGDMVGGAVINLPAAGDHTGREYKIKNTGLTSVTINAQSTEQVNGNQSDSVYSDGKTYISNGTAWFSI